MNRIVVNTRSLKSDLTGVQRYTSEVFMRLCDHMDEISTVKKKSGFYGHLWEQFCLPAKLNGRTLFSPSNTGPISVKKQVVTIHDVAALDHPERLNPKFAAWYRYLTPRLVRRVARVITISEYSKERLLTHVPMDERRVIVIPNGVDARFRPQPSKFVGEMRTRLGLPCERYVLCVGTLEPRKNIPRLLQAWARIVSSLPDDIWLILTGKQGQENMFAKLSGMDVLPPRVFFTGHVADELLPGLYAGAMVFAFPSLYEGFGLPPLEAMASGVPVLTGNLTSLPEVVGGAGIMVDPTSVDDISDGLLELVENHSLREELISKGLARAAQFDWDEAARRTWSVLQEVAEE